MLLDVTEGVHVEADSADRVDRNVKEGRQRDGEQLRDDHVSEGQKGQGQPAENKPLMCSLISGMIYVVAIIMSTVNLA